MVLLVSRTWGYRLYCEQNSCIYAEFTSCVPRSLFKAAEGLDMRCVPRSVFRYSTCVAVVSHAAAVKTEPVRVDQVIRSEKGKDFIAIKIFKFRFQKITAESAAQMKNVNAM